MRLCTAVSKRVLMIYGVRYFHPGEAERSALVRPDSECFQKKLFNIRQRERCLDLHAGACSLDHV